MTDIEAVEALWAKGLRTSRGVVSGLVFVKATESEVANVGLVGFRPVATSPEWVVLLRVK